jgi:predicted RNase H-like HicB family nuclease
MIPKVSVCVTVGPEATDAFAPDYPGCWVYGKTKTDALQQVKNNVNEWFDWMKRHGDNFLDSHDNVEIEVAEMLRVDYDPSEAGTPEPLFWSEVAPITKDDIVRTLRLMAYSRDDLLAVIKSLNDKQLDWQPPVKLLPIRDCLTHIARAELWYLTRLNEPWPEEIPESLTGLLEYSRGIVAEYLKNFPKRKMKGIFQPRKYPSPVCNLWTARKVLRRIIDHERLHTRDIKKVVELYKDSAREERG